MKRERFLLPLLGVGLNVNMKCRKEMVLNLMFYVGFFLVSLSTMMDRSALIIVPDNYVDLMKVVGMSLFVIKFMFNKNSMRGFLVGSSCILVVTLLMIFVNLHATILMMCCAFVAMKNVNVRTVLKIDILIKALFLTVHSLIFAVDYLSGSEMILEFINETKKGTAASLYFVNSNTAGLTGVWIAIELLFLNDKKKWQNYIIPTVIATFTFLTTMSRTSFLVYIIYLALQLVKSNKALTDMQKMAYPICCLLSFMMVSLLEPGMPLYDALNSFLSGRVGLSIMAYDLVGVSFFPNSVASIIFDGYPIDNFYVKCLTIFGIVAMIMAYVPHLLIPQEGKKEVKRISIITSLYLLSESVLINIGFTPAYLIMADAFLNKKKEEKNDK